MDSQDQLSGRQPVRGAVRGAFRSVHLGWTDPVTGEHLTVETQADSGFLRALESKGFERIAQGGPGSDQHVLARARATGAGRGSKAGPDSLPDDHNGGGAAIAG